ncbi:MAG: carbohydrate ABC transporter permease [Acetobacteraceae bacterium]
MRRREPGRDQLLGFALLTPTLVLFLLLIGYPLVYSLVLSLQDTNTLTLAGHFVGLRNFREIFADDEFWAAFAHTLIWTGGTLALQLVLGIGMALLLHGPLFGRGLARGLVLFPYLLPTAVAVLVWRWLFNDLYGFLDYVLVASGIVAHPVPWLSRNPDAMISVIVVGAWKFFPFVVIAVLARLQSIPEPLYEAARVDGASSFAQFFDITLPQLSGVLAIVILLRSIWDFKEFDLVYLMTGGGPGTSTETLPILVYREAFQLLSFGRGAAIAVAMLAFLLVIFGAYIGLSRRLEERGA